MKFSLENLIGLGLLVALTYQTFAGSMELPKKDVLSPKNTINRPASK